MKHTMLLLVLLGCDIDEDKASDMQDEAAKAQAEARENIVDARSDARVTIDDARAEPSQEVRQAQAEANRTISGAEGDFRALREEYRHERSMALLDPDSKIAHLEANALTANGDEWSRREVAL